MRRQRPQPKKPPVALSILLWVGIVAVGAWGFREILAVLWGMGVRF